MGTFPLQASSSQLSLCCHILLNEIKMSGQQYSMYFLLSSPPPRNPKTEVFIQSKIELQQKNNTPGICENFVCSMYMNSEKQCPSLTPISFFKICSCVCCLQNEPCLQTCTSHLTIGHHNYVAPLHHRMVIGHQVVMRARALKLE